jgi:hypothetical protein
LSRPVRLDPTGVDGPTRGQARGSKWRATSHGYYVPSTVDGTVPEQRILEQSVRLPDGGAVTGWAGCRLHGARFFDGLRPDGRTLVPVPLATGGRNVRGDEAALVLRDPLPPDEVVTRFGIACTVPARALFDAMRTAENLREAIVDMDMMAAAERVSILRMKRYLEGHTHFRGSRQVGRALDLASEDSRSPNETRTRLIWVLDAGLPTPAVNRPVFSLDGRLLGIADLLDEEAGLVGEFDGADHRAAARHSKDVQREDRFRRHGLEVFRVTGPDLLHPERVVNRMLSARQRALSLPPGRRAWTTRPPPWWEPSSSLDDFLDHREVLRELYGVGPDAQMHDRHPSRR